MLIIIRLFVLYAVCCSLVVAEITWNRDNIDGMADYCIDHSPQRIVLSGFIFSYKGSWFDFGEFCSAPINNLDCPRLHTAVKVCDLQGTKVWVDAEVVFNNSTRYPSSKAWQHLKSEFDATQPFKDIPVERFIIRIVDRTSTSSSPRLSFTKASMPPLEPMPTPNPDPLKVMQQEARVASSRIQSLSNTVQSAQSVNYNTLPTDKSVASDRKTSLIIATSSTRDGSIFRQKSSGLDAPHARLNVSLSQPSDTRDPIVAQDSIAKDKVPGIRYSSSYKNVEEKKAVAPKEWYSSVEWVV